MGWMPDDSSQVQIIAAEVKKINFYPDTWWNRDMKTNICSFTSFFPYYSNKVRDFDILMHVLTITSLSNISKILFILQKIFHAFINVSYV